MKKLLRKRNLFLLAALLILAGAGLLLFLKRRHTTKTVTPIAINSNPAGSNTNTVATPNPNVQGGTPGNNVPAGELQAPSGTFVSNHHVSLNPNDDRNREQSTCTTTPDVTCEITFTQGSVVKSLGPMTASQSRSSQLGTASWPVWTPASIGLTAGTWKITATASRNGQSKSTTDTVNLEVSQ